MEWAHYHGNMQGRVCVADIEPDERMAFYLELVSINPPDLGAQQPNATQVKPAASRKKRLFGNSAQDGNAQPGSPAANPAQPAVAQPAAAGSAPVTTAPAAKSAPGAAAPAAKSAPAAAAPVVNSAPAAAPAPVVAPAPAVAPSASK